MDCGLLRFRGRQSDERGPGHQIECGISQFRDVGGRHMAPIHHFGARQINNSNRPIEKSVWSRRQESPADSVALPLGLRSETRGLETSDDQAKS